MVGTMKAPTNRIIITNCYYLIVYISLFRVMRVRKMDQLFHIWVLFCYLFYALIAAKVVYLSVS